MSALRLFRPCCHNATCETRFRPVAIFSRGFDRRPRWVRLPSCRSLSTLLSHLCSPKGWVSCPTELIGCSSRSGTASVPSSSRTATRSPFRAGTRSRSPGTIRNCCRRSWRSYPALRPRRRDRHRPRRRARLRGAPAQAASRRSFTGEAARPARYRHRSSSSISSRSAITTSATGRSPNGGPSWNASSRISRTATPHHASDP